MKILQNIVLSAALATSMVAFSTSTMANEKKEAASVDVLIKNTLEHIQAAIAGIDSNATTDVITAHIKEARQTQKDITVGALDQKRQHASSKLIRASRDIKDGQNKEGRAILVEALADFQELEKLAK
jgi:hypothetical protein